MPDPGLVTLVGSNAAVLVGPNCPDVLLADLRDAVQSRTPLTEIVSALASVSSEALPSFACVVLEGATARLLVRGKAAAIALDQASGKRLRLFKPQAAKWSEKLVESASEVVLTWEENLATPVYVVFFLAQRSVQKKKRAAAAAAPNEIATPAAPAVSPPAASETLADWEKPAKPRVAQAKPPTSPANVPPGDDFDFSHLVEETQYRGVEAAAVRAAPAADEGFDTPQFVEPTFEEPAFIEPAAAESLSPSTQVFEDSLDRPSWTPPPLMGDAPPPQPPTPTNLIESPPSVVSREARPAAPIFDQDGGLDDATVAPRQNLPVFDQDGGLDDATVSRASLMNARTGAAVQSGTGPQVQAVVCPSGHPNSPVSPSCRICDLQITDRAVVRTGRPSLGLLQFDDGLVVDLDRSLLIGRNPKRRDNDDPAVVGVVVVPDDGRALSRTHVEIALNDWQISVVDLGSTNGTVVDAPGEEPVRLRASEQHIVVPGTRVILGGEVGFLIEPPPA